MWTIAKMLNGFPKVFQGHKHHQITSSHCYVNILIWSKTWPTWNNYQPSWNSKIHIFIKKLLLKSHLSVWFKLLINLFLKIIIPKRNGNRWWNCFMCQEWQWDSIWWNKKWNFLSIELFMRKLWGAACQSVIPRERQELLQAGLLQ